MSQLNEEQRYAVKLQSFQVNSRDKENVLKIYIQTNYVYCRLNLCVLRDPNKTEFLNSVCLSQAPQLIRHTQNTSPTDKAVPIHSLEDAAFFIELAQHGKFKHRILPRRDH